MWNDIACQRNIYDKIAFAIPNIKLSFKVGRVIHKRAGPMNITQLLKF